MRIYVHHTFYTLNNCMHTYDRAPLHERGTFTKAEKQAYSVLWHVLCVRVCLCVHKYTTMMVVVSIKDLFGIWIRTVGGLVGLSTAAISFYVSQTTYISFISFVFFLSLGRSVYHSAGCSQKNMQWINCLNELKQTENLHTRNIIIHQQQHII